MKSMCDFSEFFYQWDASPGDPLHWWRVGSLDERWHSVWKPAGIGPGSDVI